MTRLGITLLGLLTLEIFVGIASMGLRKPVLVPPLPNMSGYNAYTVQRLQELHSDCDPESAAAWMELSDAYIAHGFYPEAEACARIASQLAPRDGDIRFRWAFVLSSIGRLDESANRFEEALSLGKQNPEAVQYFIGRDQLRAERVEKATAALSLAESLPAARYELAKLDLRRGKPNEAIERLESIQQELPNVYAPHLLRAQAEVQLGHAEAAADYRLISQLNRERMPTPMDEFRVRYLNQLGRYALSEFVQKKLLQLERGQARQVIKDLEQLTKLGFEPQIEDLLAAADEALGNRQQQQARLKQIIDRDGASTYRCWRLAMAFMADQQPDEAIDWLEIGLRLDGRDSMRESHESLIELYEKAGELDMARFHVGRLFYWEALQALSNADLALARQKLASSTQIEPSYAHGWYYLGLVLGLYGDAAGQAQAFRKCIQANPYHGRALAWLAAHDE